MACVTLKRSLDFDPLHSPSRPNKRRRCVPMHTSPHCTPEKVQPAPSVFRETPLTPEQIANNLRDEIKRLKKRRQIAGPSSPGSPPSPGSAPSSPEPMMEMEALACSSSSSASTSGKAEKPIFTLKQMIMIADRMCEERVEQVRNEYDNILQQKLSEQYDAFVKFIDHQIQKRFNESQAPSYLS
jgi:hypothetical protein